MDLKPNKSKIDNEESLAMLWGSSLRFSQPSNHRWVKCCNWQIVVGNDSMDLQLDKSNIDNENRLAMLLGSFYIFSHLANHSSIKCCN